MSRHLKVAGELSLLAVITWIGFITIKDDPVHGLNVVPWGMKWITFTFAQAVIIFVMPPLVALVILIAAICLLRWQRPTNYWKIYRVSFVIVCGFAALMMYGIWYGGRGNTLDLEGLQQFEENRSDLNASDKSAA